MLKTDSDGALFRFVRRSQERGVSRDGLSKLVQISGAVERDFPFRIVALGAFEVVGQAALSRPVLAYEWPRPVARAASSR